MGKIFEISFLFITFVITSADAAIVELPLAAEGRYDVNSVHWEMDFDLGITFTEISHVYIDWSGEMMAGLAIDHTTPGPQPFPLDVGLHASLGSNPWPRLTDVYGGKQLIQSRKVLTYRVSLVYRGQPPGLTYSTARVRLRLIMLYWAVPM
ncbi:MAG: hypothetical protein GWN67_09830 [Phycisphaerae bacterium]|nr:hypothetical protein [Phycisphaerae bacterium]NIS51387.1 hypothetical protein [Phycisphaerae bacterium]NIU09002.1 hypothetical protein [Phycisphaerae bacterium]NIU56662.1 hypothetical protein [Phycisphaerae bacterium]NIV00034.1 hypothetical protein [Phycisphaerae bacterium]